MRHRPYALLALGLLLAPLTAGCSAGKAAPTSQEFSVHDGADAKLGALRIRNVHVETPPDGVYTTGADLPVYLTVVNIGTEDDALTGASSSQGTVDLVSPPPASSRPGPGPFPTPTPGPGNGSIKAGELTTFSPRSSYLLIRGGKESLRVGEFIPMTLTFERSGSIDIQVPVQTGSAPGYNPASPTPTPFA